MLFIHLALLDQLTSTTWVASGIITVVGALIFIVVGAYAFFKYRDGVNAKDEEIRAQTIRDYQDALDAQNKRMQAMEDELKSCADRHTLNANKLREAENQIHKLEGQIEVFRNYPMDWQNSITQIADFMQKTNSHMEQTNKLLTQLVHKNNRHKL